MFSIAHTHSRLLQGKPVIQIIKETIQSPDTRTRFLISHGDRDIHVKLEDSRALVRALRDWNLYVRFEVRKGKGHASDCDEPLSAALRSSLDGSESS